ncbi:MAG: amidohydrolase family protein [bacterium]|nr:amidohydrolase family protein [bacterium]
MRIDSHQHFWRYDPVEYDWIDDSMAVLRRDFLPADLRPLLDAAGIDGAIAVQASQTVAETEFLLALAADAPWIVGVVGWLDLCAADIAAQVARFAERPRLVGIRHVAQAEPDEFLARPEVVRGVATLAAHDLTYDLLVFPRQLPAAIELVRALPNQRFVLDHLAKPDLRSGEIDGWQRDLHALAEFDNVACKLSGLVTEADWQAWQPATLEPALAAGLAAFGPQRLLYGSDWPVCLCASSYERWFATMTSWLAVRSAEERAAIGGENAAIWYPRIAKP